MGNLNNVLRVPARSSPPSSPVSAPSPVFEKRPEPEPEVTKAAAPTTSMLNGFVETAKQAAVSMVEAIAPGTAVTPAETPIAEVRARPSAKSKNVP